MSMHQKDVGIHPAPEPSPACVYAVKEPDEKLHFIAGSKWGYCALLYGQDKCVCSSVTELILHACSLMKSLSAVCWCLRTSPQWETLVGALLPKRSQTPEVWNKLSSFICDLWVTLIAEAVLQSNRNMVFKWHFAIQPFYLGVLKFSFI